MGTLGVGWTGWALLGLPEQRLVQLQQREAE